MNTKEAIEWMITHKDDERYHRVRVKGRGGWYEASETEGEFEYWYYDGHNDDWDYVTRKEKDLPISEDWWVIHLEHGGVEL